MNTFLDQTDEVQFSEPIMPKKDCLLKIHMVEATEWTPKEAVRSQIDEAGYLDVNMAKKYKAMKIQLQVIDPDAKCYHPDAKPRMIEDQFNLERYPYIDKDTGEIKYLGRQKLYQLERAMGFDPCFVDAETGEEVAPRITRRGTKVAPKGAKQKLNADFANAYFTEGGTPKVDNWLDKEVIANVGFQESEQYGDKNNINSYKSAEQA